MAGESKYIICCDFDGVLHSYTSGWQGHSSIIKDGPVPGAMEWVTQIARDERFELAIYSSRSKEAGGRIAMSDWLHTHLTKFFENWGGLDHQNARVWAEKVVARLTFPTQKPAASMTIDDRAFHFQGRFPTPEWLLGFKPWTKLKDQPPWLIPRPPAARLQQIREDFLADFADRTTTDHLDSTDAAVGDLLAELEYLRGSMRRRMLTYTGQVINIHCFVCPETGEEFGVWEQELFARGFSFKYVELPIAGTDEPNSE